MRVILILPLVPPNLSSPYLSYPPNLLSPYLSYPWKHISSLLSNLSRNQRVAPYLLSHHEEDFR
jgi:hypothetical protein